MAELDVLITELARGQEYHRENCRACEPGDCPELVDWRRHLDGCKACRGDAPLTYGSPCERHAQFVAHGAGCVRCNPCPGLTKSIKLVAEWREARDLLSKAAWLRHEQDERDAA